MPPYISVTDHHISRHLWIKCPDVLLTTRLHLWHVQLANGRVLPLAQLRGSVRAVIVAGTAEQVGDGGEGGGGFRCSSYGFKLTKNHPGVPCQLGTHSLRE
jgi:hypothetical protein